MRNIHIDDSYCVWDTHTMRDLINLTAKERYGSGSVEVMLNRPFWTLYVEWWLHNIGYYLTKPFCKFATVERLNKRFKDVDLQEWGAGNG